MKKTLFTAFFSLLLAAASSAATIALGRGGSTNGYTVFEQVLTGDAGANLSIAGGFYIAVGTYATEPVITTHAQYLSAVQNFQVFASVLSPTTGSTTGSVTGSFVATNAAFNGVALYILIGNGTTRENSSQFAIIRLDAPPPLVIRDVFIHVPWAACESMLPMRLCAKAD